MVLFNRDRRKCRLQAAVLDSFLDAVVAGAGAMSDVLMERKNGSTLWASIRLLHARLDGGRGDTALLRDITAEFKWRTLQGKRLHHQAVER